VIKVTYGTRPGVIVLNYDGQAREPIQIWDYREVLKLALDLCEAMHKAWPDKATTPPPSSEQPLRHQE
jgi:hypothetical protein